ncbi:hypothetical protein Vafri_15870 [Volvox africanus]|uniref:DUF7906 domain-containing protein n=1 Tax=Volvox africanus TaxID=51714 RepID=A0A8J4F5W3_9CHLO|nr:hypothetical protein Vafri_15870 [Volvox africanus]
MVLKSVFLQLLLFTLAAVLRTFAKDANVPGSTDPTTSHRQLKRTSGKRWDAIHDVIRAEIKSATKQFLEERSRALVLPIEVDLLLVGFEGDGGYGYELDRHALDELLGTATEDNTICPTVWETGEAAAVCFAVNYITLDTVDVTKGIERMEAALVHNMEWVGDRAMDWPDGSRDVQVYEVEANGEIEATVWGLLDDAYGGKEPEVNRRQHSQIVIINPSKLRMRATLPPPPNGHDRYHSANDPELANREKLAAGLNFMAKWTKGQMTSADVVQQEAGFLYRYKYSSRGGGAAFLGQYNFLVIDISAGPVSYGPLVSPSGAVTPTAMPRLMPMLLRMTREVETNNKPGTLHEHILGEAARGQAAIFAGQLASTIASATRHLFATDLFMAAADGLGGTTYSDGPKRVVVPILVLQDHVRELEREDGGLRWLDNDMIQLALDEMLPPDISGSVSVSRHMLHHHKQLAAALIKARHSRSNAVLTSPPDIGLHRSQVISLDSAVLLRELKLAAADDDLMGGLVDHIGDDYVDHASYTADTQEFMGRRKRETKVLPVFVFSLERAPEHFMFDDNQLVAASQDVVAVLQLLGKSNSGDGQRGRVYSGHMSESHPLMLDADEQPSRTIIAGLATALGGIVPVHQRYCRAERTVVEDWRWSVGAVPWGPYSNYTALSSVLAATARRNMLVARIEKPLRTLIAALNRIDELIVKHLQGPFAYLRNNANAAARTPPYGEESPSPLYHNMPHHHLLDDLARLHVRYQNDSEGPTKRIIRNLMAGMKGSGTRAYTSSPSPPSSDAHSPHTDEFPQQQQPQQPEQQQPNHRGRHLQGFHEDDVQGHGFPGHEYHQAYDHQEGHGGKDFDGEHPPEEYDPNAYDHPIVLSKEEVAARAAGETGTESDHSPTSNPADLLTQQVALSPNVTQRLKAALDEISVHLEYISYVMFNRNWAELEEQLTPFNIVVDNFAAAVDRELIHAAEVIGCCSVRHVPTGSGTWFAVGLVATALGVFGIAAALAIRSQKVYGNPYSPRSSGGAQRTLSQARSLSGSLPSWSGPSAGPALPR